MCTTTNHQPCCWTRKEVVVPEIALDLFRIASLETKFPGVLELTVHACGLHNLCVCDLFLVL